MSSMYTMNSKGLRTDPYGTPLVTGVQSEAAIQFFLSNLAHYLRSQIAWFLTLTYYKELYQRPFENQDTQCLMI